MTLTFFNNIIKYSIFFFGLKNESLLQKNCRILQSKKQDEGFSLVELVIVIAVLAILSAVAIQLSREFKLEQKLLRLRMV